MSAGLPRAAIVAFALLMLVEFGAARQDWIWRWLANSDVGVIDAVESQVIAQSNNPQIVFLGNSRVRDAVSPRQLEDELGLPNGAVVNAAITDAQPIDLLLMYRRNRNMISQAEILVIGAELRSFNNRPPLNGRMQRYLGLRDRVEMFWSTPDLLPSIVGYFWRTYGLRHSLRQLVSNIARMKPRPLPIGQDGRVQWRDAGTEEVLSDEAAGTHDYAERNFNNLSPSSLQEEQLTALIREAQDDGLRVVVLHVPVRQSLLTILDAEYPTAFRGARQTLMRVAEIADVELIYRSGAEIYGSDQDFFDYGHLTPSGCSKMTTEIAHQIRQRQLLDTPTRE